MWRLKHWRRDRKMFFSRFRSSRVFGAEMKYLNIIIHYKLQNTKKPESREEQIIGFMDTLDKQSGPLEWLLLYRSGEHFTIHKFHPSRLFSVYVSSNNQGDRSIVLSCSLSQSIRVWLKLYGSLWLHKIGQNQYVRSYPSPPTIDFRFVRHRHVWLKPSERWA